MTGFELAGRRVLVVGLARSGQAAAEALRRADARVVGFDRDDGLDVGRLRELGVEVHLGAEEETLLQGIDLVVKSPGVPGETVLVERARMRGLPVWSEIELGARLLPNPLLGVTGSNGKTTTAELLGAVFRAAGKPVEVAGNVGRPLTSLSGSASPDAWVVCELSSFQLEDVHTLKPRVAVLLNLEPDHLDRHGTFQKYAAAKLRVFERQTAEDTAVLPRERRHIPGAARHVHFSADDALPAEPRIRGPHNRENAAAATAAARAAGVDDSAIAEALTTFEGVPHRIELIREVRGVRFVNDSKATNVAAALRALASFPDERLHVILGGRGKHEPYAPLAAAFRPDDRAYLIGETSRELAAALDGAAVSYLLADDLETAVSRAADAATPGDVVLLSPACASFDQFRDFEERGDAFRALVEALC